MKRPLTFVSLVLLVATGCVRSGAKGKAAEDASASTDQRACDDWHVRRRKVSENPQDRKLECVESHGLRISDKHLLSKEEWREVEEKKKRGEAYKTDQTPRAETIQKVIRASFADFRSCYEQGLGRDPFLEGKIAIEFTIGLDGEATDARLAMLSLPDCEVAACVLDAFERLEFPKPSDDVIRVTYPIAFAPGLPRGCSIE